MRKEERKYEKDSCYEYAKGHEPYSAEQKIVFMYSAVCTFVLCVFLLPIAWLDLCIFRL